MKRFDLWYSEGPGTSRYRVLFNVTRGEAEARKQKFDNSHAVWEILPHEPTSSTTLAVTVNGQAAVQWAKDEEGKLKSREISQFVAAELRTMSRLCYRGGGTAVRTRPTVTRTQGSDVRVYR